jgi:hypothetical protein
LFSPDKPEKIFDDWEIMSWGHELTKPRENVLL